MNKLDLKEFFGIFKFIKPNKPAYAIILLIDCLTEISFYLLTPVVMKIMTDAAVGADMELLKKGLLLTLLVSMSGMVIFVTIEFFLFRSFSLTTTGLIKLTFKKILHLPVSYIEQNHSGDTVSRLANDVGTMENAYGWPFRMIVVTLLQGVGSALIMFILDWKVSIVLIIIGLLSVLINVKQKDLVRKLSGEIQKSLGRYTESLSNIIGGFMTVKSLRLEKFLLDNACGINGDIYEKNLELTKKSAFVESRNFFFGTINFIGVILLASFLAMRGLSSLGSVMSMVLLLGNVNRLFSQINGMIIQMQGYLAGAERVTGLMDTESEAGSIQTEAVDGSDAVIEMKEIEFSYDNKNNVLEGINLAVGKGQVAALVGPSGGGKSTVIKIIMGFYQPRSGKMTIDGKPVKTLSMQELRSLIAYVPQDAYVFDCTVGENIGYGRPGASQNDIIAAAKAAHADEFICEMPNGYDTVVGERGVKLSGGQRQRIAIARAFLKDAPILLLDEATSSLDSQSEQQVQEALGTLMKGKTALIIAHRLSTIENADVIYLVENGRVSEYGSHNELMSLGKLYRTLYEKQFRISEAS